MQLSNMKYPILFLILNIFANSSNSQEIKKANIQTGFYSSPSCTEQNPQCLIFYINAKDSTFFYLFWKNTVISKAGSGKWEFSKEKDKEIIFKFENSPALLVNGEKIIYTAKTKLASDSNYIFAELVDAFNKPISYAGIYIAGTNKGWSADSNGIFKTVISRKIKIEQLTFIKKFGKPLVPVTITLSKNCNFHDIKITMPYEDSSQLSTFEENDIMKFYIMEDGNKKASNRLVFIPERQETFLNLLKNAKYTQPLHALYFDTILSLVK